MTRISCLIVACSLWLTLVSSTVFAEEPGDTSQVMITQLETAEGAIYNITPLVMPVEVQTMPTSSPQIASTGDSLTILWIFGLSLVLIGLSSNQYLIDSPRIQKESDV